MSRSDRTEATEPKSGRSICPTSRSATLLPPSFFHYFLTSFISFRIYHPLSFKEYTFFFSFVLHPYRSFGDSDYPPLIVNRCRHLSSPSSPSASSSQRWKGRISINTRTTPLTKVAISGSLDMGESSLFSVSRTDTESSAEKLHIFLSMSDPLKTGKVSRILLVKTWILTTGVEMNIQKPDLEASSIFW